MTPTFESRLAEAQRLIWRNLPGHPTTFGPCSRGCGGHGRGSGPCLECAKKDLAELVGPDKALRYVLAVREVRDCEAEMQNAAG